MAIPDYADPRSHEFFANGFVGFTHGDNGTSYARSWDSRHPELKVTATVAVNYRAHCVYCGNRAMPIQNQDLDVTGYTCPCKGALDEVEYLRLVEELREQFDNDLESLTANAAPVPSEEVLRRSMNSMVSQALEDAKRSLHLRSSPAERATCAFKNLARALRDKG